MRLICAVLRWKKTSFDHLRSALKVLLPATLVLAFLIAYLIDFRSSTVVLCGLGCGLLLTMVAMAGAFSGNGLFSRSYFGMSLAHVGFAISIIGVACTTVFSVEEDVRMEPGDTQIIGPLKVSFVGVSDVPGPNYIAKREFLMLNAMASTQINARKAHLLGGEVMTEAGIEAGLWADTYISMGEPLTDDAWAVRLHHKPLFGGSGLAVF